MSLDVNISEPDDFNCVELHSVIEDIAKTHDMDEFIYHVDSVCGRGEHYVANLFRVYVFDEKQKDNCVQVIVKTLLNSTRETLFHRLHEREVLVYDEVLPEFQEIQKNINDVNERLLIMKRYYPREELHKEVILLEDMLERGFVMRDKTKAMDYEHADLVVRNLAKLHAFSYVLKIREPVKFETFKDRFSDIVFSEDFLNESNFKDYFSESFSTSVKVVTDVSAKLKLEELASTVIDRMNEFVKATDYSVLCHGDCWTNNMLFKYQEETPKDVCLLDYQAMRYSSPVTDILYFMYLCTDSSFRMKYSERLQRSYYRCLKDVLKNYDVEAELVYPEDSFQKDLSDYALFGFLVAMTEIKIVTLSVDEEKFLTNSDLLDSGRQAPDALSSYIDRVNDVVQEFKNKGHLESL
ncbi:hypothetical protein EVAR_49423_1 [Eumeta japonica]|uniref:CHK kinase-like domain-containing protein n=1 Tax=Eumeta variegata TaxID=151549 RepID=A0A4C1YY61_EUMVA|nr:hypothetical protein EVAR_49423_1 [Eumeta japonica]